MKSPKNIYLTIVCKSLLTLFLIAFTNLIPAMAQGGTLQLNTDSFTLIEGDYNNPVVSLQVTRTGDFTQAVSVQYSTNNGTAVGGAFCNLNQGGDFISTTGTLSWAAGDASPKTLNVTTCGDFLIEPFETFSINLSNATGGAVIGTPSTALVTIINNDEPTAIIQFDPPIYYENEGTIATVSVTRTSSLSEIGIINYSTANSTATGGTNCGSDDVDYVRTSGRLVFAPRDVTKTFTIQICNDSLLEGNETVRLVFSYDFPTLLPITGTLVIRGKTFAGGDFDGDGKSDVSVFRPSDGTWYILQSQAGTPKTIQYGLATDRLVPADYDGDGKIDIAVFRAGAWYFLNSSNNSFNAVQFGNANDIPVPADYTGDGRAELAVYRSGAWYTLNLVNNQFLATQFGISSDKPVPADFDGDGKIDLAVFRDGVWYWIRSIDFRFGAAQFGLASDKPVVGDYDGDGRADQAVYRNGVWYVLGSIQGFYGTQFGIASDIPVAADYDGDGRTDLAVYRNGIWYLLRTQQGFFAVPFGAATDRPIPAVLAP